MRGRSIQARHRRPGRGAARLACRWSTGLIPIDASGPTDADLPPSARLGDAPHLQALREPSPHLDIVPRHVLQQHAARGWAARSGELIGWGSGAVAVHVLFGAAFIYLLSFRDAETPREVEIPVEVVQEAPKAAGQSDGPRASRAQGDGSRPSAGPASDPAKPDTPGGAPPSPRPLPTAKPATPDSKLAAALSTPAAQPPAPKATAQPAPSRGEPAPPKLVAPPPDAGRSATQDRDNKAANLVPDERQADQALHEAHPAAIPDVLTTSDPKAEPSVPVPAKADPAPVDKPTPPIPAKVPSTADKLAAALPMSSAAMPMSFRSVLAGNAAAQINAAYAGVVQGRIRQAQAELARTAYARHLSGNVAVTFTVDDSGKVSGLAVVQSSGDAQLDALALHAIELAAPFPPPPPEAEHTFNKAFLVGG